MSRQRIPAYRCYKPKNLGLVVLGGKQFYLGKYGTPESLAEYNRLIQEWLARGEVAPGDALNGGPFLVDELILAFWTGFAEQHYRHPDGTPTGELDNYRDSLKLLRRLYGQTPARDFGPASLKAVRRAMIEAGLARTTINQRIGRVVRLFKWAVENELVPTTVHQGLRAVAALQEGRSGAKEAKPVGPVDDARVEAIQHDVSRQVWAMVQLQQLTGMRPGEVTTMRPCDLDTSGEVWVYRPSRHKTSHRGHHREVYLGRRAQEVLEPWLGRDASSFLFSPREAVAERMSRREDPDTPGCVVADGEPPRRSPGRAPGARYTTRTYCQAVRYGCKRAGVASWHPHQLRHGAATWLRSELGLDVAQAVLGHRTAAATENYAHLDRDKAQDAMGRLG